jgi:uncharacterized damage-inducible protein DinB
MTYGDVILLIDYNYWARDRLLEAVAALSVEQFTRPLGNSFSSIRDTVAHICDAESIWLRRWRGEQPQGFQDPGRMPDLAAAREEWSGTECGIREMVATLGPEGVERVIDYKDLRGAARSDVFWQMLQHVVNHGSYHRGQVTTMLRQLNAAPPAYMDMIVFYREKRQSAL